MTALPVIHAAGQPRALGCLPPRPDFGGLPRYSARRALLPRTSWEEVDISGYQVPVMDQGSSSSCVGHGSCTAFWFSWLMAGYTVPDGGFSPTSIYAEVNDGVDEGAIVSDAMKSVMTDGVSTMDLFPEADLFLRQEGAASKAMRLRFRAEGAEHVDSFDALGSALVQFREPVVFGFVVNANFETLDGRGVAGFGGPILGGHCVCAYGLTRLPSGEWAVRVRNSWGTSWGVGGNCLMLEKHLTFKQSELDAFRITIPAADPDDPNPMPAA